MEGSCIEFILLYSYSERGTGARMNDDDDDDDDERCRVVLLSPLLFKMMSDQGSSFSPFSTGMVCLTSVLCSWPLTGLTITMSHGGGGAQGGKKKSSHHTTPSAGATTTSTLPQLLAGLESPDPTAVIKAARQLCTATSSTGGEAQALALSCAVKKR